MNTIRMMDRIASVKRFSSKKSTSAFRLQIVCLGCPNQYCSRDSKCHSEKIPVSPAHSEFQIIIIFILSGL